MAATTFLCSSCGARVTESKKFTLSLLEVSEKNAGPQKGSLTHHICTKCEPVIQKLIAELVPHIQYHYSLAAGATSRAALAEAKRENVILNQRLDELEEALRQLKGKINEQRR